MNLVRMKLNIITSSGIQGACEISQHVALLIAWMRITQHQILLVFTPKYTFISSSRPFHGCRKPVRAFCCTLSMCQQYLVIELDALRLISKIIMLNNMTTLTNNHQRAKKFKMRIYFLVVAYLNLFISKVINTYF